MNTLDLVLDREASPVDANWQMFPGERLALEQIIRISGCKIYAEVGVWYGGSLIMASAFVEKAIGLDIDSAVLKRFDCPPNAEIVIGSSSDNLLSIIANDDPSQRPSVLLIDGDHSYEQVSADLEIVASAHLNKLIVVLHDTGHESVRRACVDTFERYPNMIALDLDVVPGRVIMHEAGKGEIWGGLGIGLFSNEPRENRIFENSAEESIRCVNLNYA